MKGSFVLVVGNSGNCTQWQVNCCHMVSCPVYIGKGHKVSELHDKSIQNFFFYVTVLLHSALVENQVD